MNTQHTYNGSCFCGKVKFTLTGEPVLMAYCHCDSCRHWSAGPVNAFTLWNPQSINITQGADNIMNHNKTPGSSRTWCKSCGGHLFIDHPDMSLIDIPAAVIPDFSFKPTLHVNYQESVLPMKDGMPKFKDLPLKAGGSGDVLTE